MGNLRTVASPGLAAFLLFAAAGSAFAAPAVPVVEDRSAASANANPPPVSAAPGQVGADAPAPVVGSPPAQDPEDDLFGPPLTDDNTVVADDPVDRTSPVGDASELVYQLQLLREEVLELRGLVEEQGYRLDRLARESQTRYMDLDRRVAGLVTGAVDPGAEGAAGDPGEPALPGEREAYTAAFELTRERQFAEAIAAFQQQLANYPDGRFAGNAFYWLGELHLALDPPDLEASRQAFAQVVNLYPTHAKVADALYKLGVVYHRLGDSDRAGEYLQQVLERHPGTTAARLADTYRSQLGG